MEKRIKIDTLKMVRKIRDRHAQLLKGKSIEEIIAFFRKRAEESHEQLYPMKRHD